jgi:hypothetical protein
MPLEICILYVLKNENLVEESPSKNSGVYLDNF